MSVTEALELLGGVTTRRRLVALTSRAAVDRADAANPFESAVRKLCLEVLRAVVHLRTDLRCPRCSAA